MEDARQSVLGVTWTDGELEPGENGAMIYFMSLLLEPNVEIATPRGTTLEVVAANNQEKDQRAMRQAQTNRVVGNMGIANMGLANMLVANKEVAMKVVANMLVANKEVQYMEVANNQSASKEVQVANKLLLGNKEWPKVEVANRLLLGNKELPEEELDFKLLGPFEVVACLAT